VPIGTTVRLLDDDGRQVPDGVVGRVHVANSSPFEGYTGGPDPDDDTGADVAVDGLMATGDLGRWRDGLLFVEGRDDEMIVSGGENVFPQEVEDLLARHSGVGDVAVVGVDDERFGQALKAFVVARGNGLSERAVQDYVKENLARFKVPREVEFIDELPRNATGKVLKRELVE